MSSEIVFFSSSSRSMRSMMALSWSLANFVAGSSWTAAAEVAIGYSLGELAGVSENSSAARVAARRFSQDDPQVWDALRQGNIAIIHSAPTGERVMLNVVMPGVVQGCPGHPNLNDAL